MSAHREQLIELLGGLPEENIRALLDVLMRLGAKEKVRRWSTAVGGATDADAEQMRRAVQEGCETIDPDTW